MSSRDFESLQALEDLVSKSALNTSRKRFFTNKIKYMRKQMKKGLAGTDMWMDKLAIDIQWELDQIIPRKVEVVTFKDECTQTPNTSYLKEESGFWSWFGY